MRGDRGKPPVQFVPCPLQQVLRQTRRVGGSQQVMQREERFGLRVHHVREPFARFRMNLTGLMRVFDRVGQLLADIAQWHTTANFQARIRAIIG